MSYIVSARKYRPQTFEDVVGQEQITHTLKRAIESDHLAQAFLFCGPRGVGKTTCARILAKAVNTGKTEQLDQIDEDFAFNIFELDAASNNKVDDMHQLIQQVRIPPQTGKYKIYIIDEVHMLSTSAFNAFLKTLEEPPPYAIFILATTEKHKILPTILSRCQIYDFKRISVNDIVGHLKNIAKEENINAADDALHIIAEKADGALRDALSIFDRLVSFAGAELTYESVVKNLNVLDYDYFFQLVDALTTEDIATSMLLFNDILNNGFEGDHFVLGLAAHLRNLMVCKDEKTLSLLEVSDKLQEKYKAQANQTPNSFLVNALSLSSDCEVQYAQSQNKRLLVELMMMKMAYAARVIEGSKLAPSEKKKPIAKTENSEADIPQKTSIPKEKTNPKTSDSAADSAVNTPAESATHSATQEKAINQPNKSNTKNIGFSLDDLEKAVEQELNEPEEEAVVEVAQEDEAGKLPLTQDNLAVVWFDFLESIKEDEDNKSLFEIIEDKVPNWDGKQLSLHVDSEVERGFVKKNLPVITGTLKSKLVIGNHTLRLKVNEVVTKRKHILNQKDKYELLVKKNPSIKDLKDQLGLDLEM